MFVYIFGSIRVSFRMVVKFFKADGKLFSLSCEKWVPKEGKQFTLFNCVKIERRDELLHGSQFTKFEVTDENGKRLTPRHLRPNTWEFEAPRRIRTHLQSNRTSAEFLAEYFRDENDGIFHFHVKNPNKNALLMEKPIKPTPKKPIQITQPLINSKMANEIAKKEVDNGFEKNGGGRFKMFHQRLATN